MKKFNTFLFLFFMALATTGFSQRYVSEVFDEYTVTTAAYGQNADIILLFDGDTTNDAHPFKHPLPMDVYQPVGDTVSERPLVLFFHTGNFFPFPANQGTGGTRKDSVAVEICGRLAKMGYVAASVDYRLGWNPYDPVELTRRWFLINAAYRGVQDARTAIRYFKKTADVGGNPWGVDPNKITLWGVGTGGYITLAAGALDAYSKTLIPKFLLPGPIPMILEQVSGDINGTSVGQVPPGYPFYTPGDTLGHINHAGYDSDFQLCVNMGGALGDSTWLDSVHNQPAYLSFHVPTDPFAPYCQGIVYVPPPCSCPVVDVIGSCRVAAIANQLGLNDAFADANFTDDFTQTADSRNGGNDGLLPFPISDPAGNDPWNFWAWNNVNAPGLADSIGAKIYIDSIMNYFAPRACLQLGLGCDLSFFSPTKEVLDAKLVGLKASPNPATSVIRLGTNPEFPMQQVYLYDLNGRLVKVSPKFKANSFDLNRNSLASGTYFAKVIFEKGIATTTVIFH